MANPLTPAKREELSHRAYALSLRGKSSREIADALGISHTTARAYVRASPPGAGRRGPTSNKSWWTATAKRSTACGES